MQAVPAASFMQHVAQGCAKRVTVNNRDISYVCSHVRLMGLGCITMKSLSICKILRGGGGGRAGGTRWKQDVGLLMGMAKLHSVHIAITHRLQAAAKHACDWLLMMQECICLVVISVDRREHLRGRPARTEACLQTPWPHHTHGLVDPGTYTHVDFLVQHAQKVIIQCLQCGSEKMYTYFTV